MTEPVPVTRDRWRRLRRTPEPTNYFLSEQKRHFTQFKDSGRLHFFDWLKRSQFAERKSRPKVWSKYILRPRKWSRPLYYVVRRTYSSYGDRCFAAARPKLWNTRPWERVRQTRRLPDQ